MSFVNSNLIHSLYEAPDKEGGWDRFLKLLSEELGNAITVLMSYDQKQRGSNLSCIAGISNEGLRAYEAYYASLNPWMSGEREEIFLDGKVHLGEELLSFSELEKTEFYNDFGRRYGVVHSMGLVFQRPGAAVIPVLGVNRDQQRGCFEPEEVELIGAIAPHLHRVLEWKYRQERYASLEAFFDELPEATWELNSSGGVLRANRLATAQMQEGRELRVRNGKLHMASGSGFRPVLDLVRRRLEGVVLGGGFLSIRPARGEGFVVVHKMPGRITRERLVAISESYHLTPAELRLLGVLLEDSGLSEAAERLGISINTVKTQLAGLFAKTGTRRQADLVRVITQLV